MISLPQSNREDGEHGLDMSIEDRARLLHRLHGVRLNPHDNIGTEWGSELSIDQIAREPLSVLPL